MHDIYFLMFLILSQNLEENQNEEEFEEDAEEEEEVFGPKILWNNFGRWHKSTTSKTPSPFWHLDAHGIQLIKKRQGFEHP